jgi:hypothetical protein
MEVFKSDTILSPVLYSSIKKIKIIRKGSAEVGMGIGIGLSIGTGVILAANVEKDPFSLYEFEKAAYIFGGILCAIPAGVIGAEIGRNSGKKFEINFDKAKFLAVNQDIFNYSEVKLIQE